MRETNPSQIACINYWINGLAIYEISADILKDKHTHTPPCYIKA